MTARAHAIFRCDGRRLRLERTIPAFLGLGKPRVEAVPLDQWVEMCPPEARKALALLWDAGNGHVRRDDASLLIDPAIIAALPEAQARVLDLPPRLPLTLTITMQGQIHLDSFALEACWTSGGGTRQRVSEQDGLLRWDGRLWHAPTCLTPVQGAMQRVNQTRTMAERAEAMAMLQGVLDAHADAALVVDRQIGDLRIRHAAGLALHIAIEEGILRFAPVLFSRDHTDMALAGEALDEAGDSLLPPALARDWAPRALAGPARDIYLLRDGSIMVLDPALARIVAALPQAARLAPEDLRTFVINPRAILAQACGLPGHVIDTVLVETTHYAAAVRHLDLWRRPVRPWLTLTRDGNRLAAQGLCLGDGDEAQWLNLPADRLPMVLSQANLALASRQASFVWADHIVPATAALRSALQALLTLTATPLDDGPLPEALAACVFRLRDAQSGTVTTGPLGQMLANPVAAPPPPPARPIWPMGLTASPVPHQQAGFAWLVEHWQTQSGGAIWADAPGLGAKLPLMAFLIWLSEQLPLPSLLVVATTDMAGWRQALASLAPDLAARTRLVADADGGEAALSAARLVLTSYEMLRDCPQIFARQTFAAVMLDRAEQMHSPAGHILRAVQILDARLRVARVAPPMDAGQGGVGAVLAAVRPDAALADLPQAPWLLHRRREDCRQSLPLFHDHVVAMAMPPRQRKAYDQLLHRAQALRGCEDAARMDAMLDQLDAISRAAFVPGEGGADLVDLSGRVAGLFQTLPAILAQGEQAIVLCHDAALRKALQPALQDRFGAGVALVDPGALDEASDTGVANHLLLLTRASHPAEHEAMVAHLHRLGQQKPVHVHWLQSVHPDPARASSSLDTLRDKVLRDRCGGLLLPPPDSTMLFDAAIASVPEPAALTLPDAPPAPPELAPTPPQAALEPQRKTGRLSLGKGATGRPVPLPAAVLADIASARAAPPATPSPPVLEIPPPSRWAARVEFMEGVARNTGIFRAPLQNDPPVQCKVIDPYAAAGASARRRTVKFLSMLLGPKPTLACIILETFDGAGFDRFDPEDDKEQKLDMQAKWSQAFPNGPALQFQQHSRTANRVMHDRNVTVVTQSGRKLIWDMGRGIDGVMRTEYRCVVTLTEL